MSAAGAAVAADAAAAAAHASAAFNLSTSTHSFIRVCECVFFILYHRRRFRMDLLRCERVVNEIRNMQVVGDVSWQRANEWEISSAKCKHRIYLVHIRIKISILWKHDDRISNRDIRNYASTGHVSVASRARRISSLHDDRFCALLHSCPFDRIWPEIRSELIVFDVLFSHNNHDFVVVVAIVVVVNCVLCADNIN